jgi:hypothetical protein
MNPAPRSTLRSGLRIGWPFALAILAGAVQLGCYKPNIKDGGLKCNLDAGVGKSCPEGFKCDMSRLTCWRNPDGGVDRATDRNDGPVDGPADMKPEVACFDARADCIPGSGTCDPYCQIGCECGAKCSINTVGLLTCNPPRAAQFPRTVMQDCDQVISSGTADQTDNCAPGLVCVEEGCFPRCFQFCRSDADCPSSACTRDIGGQSSGQKVCEVPFADTCVPLQQNSGCGPATSGMACYISSTNPSHTICDCPLDVMGPNAPCSRTRECIRGLACVDRGPSGASPTCLQVCRISDNGVNDCPTHTAGSCHPYFGVPAGAISNSTYGYCF